MNYNKFLEMLVEQVHERLGAQAIIHINQVQKINQPVIDRMTILLPGENASPAFYLDTMYQKYLDGTQLPDLADEILAFYQAHKKTGVCDLSFYRDFAKARECIICRLVNYEKNQALLQHIPHRQFLDLAIIYYYVMDSPDFGKSSILVREDHLAHWGISPDALHVIAVQNTRRLLPFRIFTITEALEHIFGYSVECPEASTSMYILTNSEMCYGAIYITFEDILNDFSNDIEDDFYVLPSSIHECLLLPISVCDEFDSRSLRKMVSEVNQKPEIVSPEDILSDNIYRYDHKTHTLSYAGSGQSVNRSV